MRPEPLIALTGLLLATQAVAESELMNLSNNPFTRPEILKPKPPPPPAPPQKSELPPERVELELSATMVSANAPMVVVEGELLSVGDSVEGFKLIAVMEGRAVFLRGGKRYTFEIDRGGQEQTGRNYR